MSERFDRETREGPRKTIVAFASFVNVVKGSKWRAMWLLKDWLPWF